METKKVLADICVIIPPGFGLICPQTHLHPASSNIHRLEVHDLVSTETCLATRRSQDTGWLSSVFSVIRSLVPFTLPRRSCNMTLGIWPAVAGSFPVRQLNFFTSLIKCSNISAKADHALVLLALSITSLLFPSYSLPVHLRAKANYQ